VHLQVTTAPAAQAVSDAEAVAHAKIDSDAATADSSLITSLALTSIKWVEGYCNRALVTQTATLELDSWEFVEPFFLPLPPFGALTTLKTFADDDTATTVASGNYRIVGDDPARIVQVGDGWTLERDEKAVELIFTCGYGAASTVPEDIKTAIRILFTDLYEGRQNYVTQELNRFDQVAALLAPYRIGHLSTWT